MLLYVKIVIDPRYKMQFFKFLLKSMYAHYYARAFYFIMRMKITLNHISEAYIELEERYTSSEQQHRTNPPREDVSNVGNRLE